MEREGNNVWVGKKAALEMVESVLDKGNPLSITIVEGEGIGDTVRVRMERC